MRHVLALSLVVTGALASTATAVLAPTRTVVEPTRITHLSLTGRSVVYSVAENASRTTCGSVRLWNTSTRGLWRFGDSTTRVCREAPSTGSGIAATATSGTRVFWVTFAGGNVRDFTLWTATPTRRSPRRLADASSGADSGEQAIVLAGGSREGVAWAVDDTVTFVADSGARRFRSRLPRPVRLLAVDPGPGAARVAAALDDGRVVTLARDGRVISTSAAGAVVSALALSGDVVSVQRGTTVSVDGRTVSLPARGLMLDSWRGRIVYTRGPEVRARELTTGADVLLRRVAVEAGERPRFATGQGGSAWAEGSTVRWTAEPLP